MSDPKDELRARFDEQANSDEMPSDDTDSSNPGTTDNSNNTGDSHNTNNSSNSGNPSDADNTEETAQAETTPGPNKDTTATRHRRQVPMYLPDKKAAALNDLYERIDARSKIAGNGGIEKHADFMEQLVEFAIDHESDLAEQLGVES
mgnify:FL=1